MKFFEDILVIIVHVRPFNHVNFLTELYDGFFPNLIFYGDETGPIEGLVPFPMEKGYYLYNVMLDVLKNHSGYKGYLLFHEDMIVNPYNFVGLDKSKIWTEPIRATDIKIPQEKFTHHLKVLHGMGKETIEILKQGIINKKCETLQWSNNKVTNKSINVIGQGFCDIYYIPDEFKELFIKILTPFYEKRVFLEYATPTGFLLMTCLDDNCNYIPLNMEPHVKIKRRETSPTAWIKYFKEDLHGIHPVKFSDEKNKTLAKSIIAKMIASNRKLFL